MTVPKTYKKQNGCHNCQHAFISSEYDSFNHYYCHVDKSERPLCGNVSIGECWPFIPKDAWDTACKEWDTWADAREVKEWGICDQFRLVEE